MVAEVHCESSRQLGFALSYTLSPLLPSNGEKTAFMVTWNVYFGWTTVLSTLRVTCVYVSEAPVFIWYLLRPSQPVSSFLGEVLRTVWQHCDPCFWHGQVYVACSWVGNPTNIYIPAPEGKTKNLVTFRTDGNIPISLNVFAFLFIVEQDIIFIHDAAFFFLHVCVFA